MAAQADEIAAILGEDHRGADAADVVAGAARSRCMPLATEGGASICTTRSIAPMSMPSSSDEVATMPAQRSHLEAVFDLLALRGGDAAVVRAHQDFAGEVVDRARDALGEAAAVDEDQRGRGAREPAPAAWDGSRSRWRGARGPCAAGPLGMRLDLVEPRHVVERNFDTEVELLGRAGVDDGDRPVARAHAAPIRIRRDFVGPVAPPASLPGGRPRAPPRKRGDFVERALRGGESDALELAVRRGAPGVRVTAPDALPRLLGTSAWISSRITVSTERRSRGRSTSASGRWIPAW